MDNNRIYQNNEIFLTQIYENATLSPQVLRYVKLQTQ